MKKSKQAKLHSSPFPTAFASSSHEEEENTENQFPSKPQSDYVIQSITVPSKLAVWCCTCSPCSNYIAFGTFAGLIHIYKIDLDAIAYCAYGGTHVQQQQPLTSIALLRVAANSGSIALVLIKQPKQQAKSSSASSSGTRSIDDESLELAFQNDQPPPSHGTYIRGVKFSPDSKFVGVADEKGFISVIELDKILNASQTEKVPTDASNEEVDKKKMNVVLGKHSGTARCVDFSQNGKHVFSCCAGGTNEVFVFENFQQEFMDNSSSSASSSESIMKTPTFTLEGHKDFIYCCRQSYNSKFLASCDYKGQIFVWDCENKYKKQEQIDCSIAIGYLLNLDISRDSSLIVACGHKGVVLVCAKTFTRLQTFSHDGIGKSQQQVLLDVKFCNHPNSLYCAATGDDRCIQMYDLYDKNNRKCAYNIDEDDEKTSAGKKSIAFLPLTDRVMFVTQEMGGVKVLLNPMLQDKWHRRRIVFLMKSFGKARLAKIGFDVYNIFVLSALFL